MRTDPMPWDQRRSLARRCFLEGEPVPEGLVSASVLRSWERSRHYGLSVGDKVLHGPIRASDLRDARAGLQALLNIAVPELGRLHEALPHGQWMFSCVSDAGVVLTSIGRVEAGELSSGLRAGNRLHEPAAGTTGPGCALAERRPVIISAGEHYLDEASRFSCAAVPLFDHRGRMVGVLNASSSRDCRPIQLLDALVLSSKAIQRELVRHQTAAAYLHVHARADMLGTPLEGVLAIGPDGEIVGANDDARGALREGAADLEGLAVEALLGCSLARLLDCAGDAPRRLVLGNGLCLHARVERPQETRLALAPRRPGADPASVESAEPTITRALRHVIHAMQRQLPVLIQGETGTGKEVFARASHAASARAQGPFVAVNCSAIPADLIEAELFGYEDGAFTGARRGGAPGRFEQAHGGTVLLDEIGDMPLALQAKLLRVLQERRIARLGCGAERPIDVAVVCATHLDLEALMAQKRFREDLYYRINGVRVSLPPLRERADFSQIVAHIMDREACGFQLSDDALALLAAFSWPGNIRQLDTVLRFAITALECEGGRGGIIEIDHLPDDFRAAATRAPGVSDPAARLTQEVSSLERGIVREALAARGGNRTRAARDLGISRATLYRKLGPAARRPPDDPM